MANPLTVITSLGGWKSRLSNEGVVKQLGPHWAHRFRHRTVLFQ